jgi:hypothetical protein
MQSKQQANFSLSLFIAKLHTHPIKFEPTTSPSTHSYGMRKCHLDFGQELIGKQQADLFYKEMKVPCKVT